MKFFNFYGKDGKELRCPNIKGKYCNYYLSGQRQAWSAFTNVQPDLRFCWTHKPWRHVFTRRKDQMLENLKRNYNKKLSSSK